MSWRWLRAVLVIAILGLFEGVPGVVTGAALAIAFELVGVPVGVLWGTALLAIGAAPLAMIVQIRTLHLTIGASFATSNVLARALVGLALACGLYAAIAEMMGVRGALSIALTPWERASLFIRRRRDRLEAPARPPVQGGPGPPSD